MSAPRKLHELLDAAYDEHHGEPFTYSRHEAYDGSWHIFTGETGYWQIAVTEANDGALTFRRLVRDRAPWREAES